MKRGLVPHHGASSLGAPVTVPLFAVWQRLAVGMQLPLCILCINAFQFKFRFSSTQKTRQSMSWIPTLLPQSAENMCYAPQMKPAPRWTDIRTRQTVRPEQGQTAAHFAWSLQQFGGRILVTHPPPPPNNHTDILKQWPKYQYNPPRKELCS